MNTVGLSTVVFGHSRPGAREWQLLARHGFDHVELAVAAGKSDPADPISGVWSSMRDAAADAGIHLESLSVALAEADGGVAVAEELACKRLIVRAGTCRLLGSDPKQLPDTHALRRVLEPLAASVDARGLSLAVECPASWPAQDVVRLIEALDAPPVGVVLDVGHAHLHEGVAETIEQLAGYVATIHLNDNLGRADDHRLPFSGTIEWPAVLMELEKTGYTGPLVLEVAGDPDAAGTIERAVGARTRLRAILDDLAQPMVFPE